MTARAEWVSAADAQATGLVPPNWVWNEQRQEAEPRGVALVEARVQRLAEDGLDGEKVLKAFVRTRDAVLKFVANQLQESEYKADGYPAPGKMHDFYRLPNYDKKALTKQGAEKLAQFFGLKRTGAPITSSECTKEHSFALVQVFFQDRWGSEAASGQAAASTAEAGFKRAVKKYDGDFRAAFNDVVSRAVKRASTQAIVFATATDEIFDATGEVEKVAEAKGATEEAKAPARFPAKFGSVGGKLVSEVGAEELKKILVWCKSPGRNLRVVQPVIDAIEEELDLRRDDEDEPPV